MQAKALRSKFPDALVEPQLTAGFSWKGMSQTYRELASYDYHALLRTFPGPVLILNGENDKPNRKREAALLRATQDGQVQVVKQDGHLCNLEQPEAFTERHMSTQVSFEAYQPVQSPRACHHGAWGDDHPTCRSRLRARTPDSVSASSAVALSLAITKRYPGPSRGAACLCRQGSLSCLIVQQPAKTDGPSKR